MGVLKKVWRRLRGYGAERSRQKDAVFRLFVAQGPAQLLMCETVAQYLGENEEEGQEGINICLLFGKYAFGRNSGIALAAGILSQSKTWSRIVDAYDLEDALWQNPAADFSEVIAEIRRRVGIERLDELHLARNWQLTNELVCAAFEEAEVCVCGDVLGKIDSVRMVSFADVSRAYAVLPDFHILLDDESSMTSVSTELTIIPRRYYLRIIESAAANIPAESSPGAASTKSENAALLLTSTYTEARMLSFEDEVRLVVGLALPHLGGVDRVYVKPHPRETAGQAAEVVRRLNRLNFGGEAFLFQKETELAISHLPLEVVLRRYGFRSVLTPVGSYSSVLIPWLLGIDVHLPSVDEVVAEFGKDPTEASRFFELFSELWEYRRSLETWDGASVLWSRRAQNSEVYGHLKMPDREKRWRAELQFTGKAIGATTREEAAHPV